MLETVHLKSHESDFLNDRLGFVSAIYIYIYIYVSWLNCMHLCNYSSPTTLCQTYLAHELTISDEHVFDLVIHYRKLLTSKAVASCSLLQLKKHYTFPNHSDGGQAFRSRLSQLISLAESFVYVVAL